MSSSYEKLPHECGSSDALQVFWNDKEAPTGYCFACDTYVPDPYGGKAPAKKPLLTKTKEEIESELNEINGLPVVELPKRNLRKASLEWYGIKIALSETDGQSPTVSYFPYYEDGRLLGYKCKLIPHKKMWALGDMKGHKDLFGWEQALSTGGKVLYITEGEEDAVALYQALREKQAGGKWADLQPAVVSLPNGAGGAKKDITANLSKIRHSFKDIVLVFDRDQPGQQAERDVLQILPMARTVDIPAKDANACIMEGKALALANACLFKSSIPKNTRIITASSLYETSREEPAYGLSYPWPSLTKLTRGMRTGETYYLGAGVKLGKTTIRDTLVAHLITEHKMKVFLAGPEETNKKTVKQVLGKAVGRIFHDPEIPFDFDAYDEATKIIKDDLYLLDLYQHLGWDSLRSDIMVAAQEGCKAIFIDPITNLTNGVASGEANTALQEIAQELASIALDLDLIIWIFCHLKAPLQGAAHERGGKVLSNQFAGSRAMMRSCHMMVGLEGNKDPDLEIEQRNTRRLVILEDREFGSSGFVNMYYNTNTGTYTEMKGV